MLTPAFAIGTPLLAELTARGVLEMSEADEGADLAAIVRDGLARPPAGSSAAALSPSEP